MDPHGPEFEAAWEQMDASLRAKYVDKRYALVEAMVATGRADMTDRFARYQERVNRHCAEAARLSRRRAEILENLQVLNMEKEFTAQELLRLREEEVMLGEDWKFGHVHYAISKSIIDYDELLSQIDTDIMAGVAAAEEGVQALKEERKELEKLGADTFNELKDAFSNLEKQVEGVYIPGSSYIDIVLDDESPQCRRRNEVVIS